MSKLRAEAGISEGVESLDWFVSSLVSDKDGDYAHTFIHVNTQEKVEDTTEIKSAIIDIVKGDRLRRLVLADDQAAVEQHIGIFIYCSLSSSPVISIPLSN